MNFMSPRSDVGFKKLFGNEYHKNLTISFLNSVLGKKEGNLIESITFLDIEKLPKQIQGKTTYLDIHCIDQNGNHFLIEMQNKYQDHFIERAMFYSALIFGNQLDAGFDYDKLMPVILISVLNHTLFTHHHDVVSRHVLMDSKHLTITSRYQQFYFIELPKFHKTIKQLSSAMDYWLFFMIKADTYENIPQELQKSEDLVQAFKVLEKMQWTYDEIKDYVRELDNAGMNQRIEAGALKRGLQQGLEQGLEQGLQQGLQKGLQQGIEKGLEQGKQEQQKEVALKLLKKGMDINFIIELTNLSIEQIELLQKNM
ncbi:MAG: Rpn family recombination-promoting nuclease/putative transposase [Candidatus Chromulinivorax sp.]